MNQGQPVARRSASVNLLLSNQESLYRYLHGFAGGEQYSDDAFQSVAEKLLNHPEKNCESPGYLFRSARNSTIDALRAQATRARYESAYAITVGSVENRSPEQIVDAEQALQQLQAALEELPLLTREIFLLFHVHGIPQRHIADKFELHLSTVEKRLAKAKSHCFQRIRDLL
ncbi:MAG: sigma-70 family RNA polymerase sigma factor [Pseudomonadota bacterium]